MSESLRDQLLKSGLVRQLKTDQNRKPSGNPRRPPAARNKPDRSDINLAKAYALRDQADRTERERAQREAEQRAREKKERKRKLAALLDGKGLNATDAEIPRHFPHVNKIRRIYVTEAQLPRLNGGELGVVQLAGRYLLVERGTAEAAGEIDPQALVLLCDPQAEPADDDIPADITW